MGDVVIGLRTRDIVAGFAGRRVLVVGDVMLDEYVWGRVSRISPEAPVPVVEVEELTHLAGGAANVARNLSSLGGRAYLIGLVGDDAEGLRLRRLFAENGVDASGLVVDPDRPTTVKTRVMAHNQQVVRIDRERRAPPHSETSRRVLALAAERLPEVDAVVVSDYAKGLVDRVVCARVIGLARGRGTPVVIDPKGRDYSKYSGATVITPNKAEAAEAADHDVSSEASLAAAGRRLLRSLGCEAVLVTRGEEGLSLFLADGQITHLPTFGRRVYDVTGAGDTVVSTFVLGLAAGATMAEAAYLANHAAGVVVGRIGAATVSPAELLAASERRDLNGRRRGRPAA